ncbi:lysozyme family protein [Vagococcus hydrophili]|uniref:Lysozyme family protein n=2 Tax=Vagococcus hydrophili TaxID=2714947 RepID=A0A6G8AXV8_9ENTE|nr:lysozyme family protein [Vagococcus hydrophili]
MVWEDQVTTAAKQYGIEEYSDVILAIIYTESKGDHVDLMQSSESKYGTRNRIFTSEESIESGVEHLAEVIKEADAQKCDIWTAVQAYNFGSKYINYVSDHGKKNTLEISETYSRDILAPLLGNKTQETYFYKHPFALMHNGGKLYKDGGNFFYAESVKWNLKLVKLFSKF